MKHAPGTCAHESSVARSHDLVVSNPTRYRNASITSRGAPQAIRDSDTITSIRFGSHVHWSMLSCISLHHKRVLVAPRGYRRPHMTIMPKILVDHTHHITPWDRAPHHTNLHRYHLNKLEAPTSGCHALEYHIINPSGAWITKKIYVEIHVR